MKNNTKLETRKLVGLALFTALANANINIKMIDQGSSELNIIIGVEEKDYTNAIKAIYNKFVNGENK